MRLRLGVGAVQRTDAGTGLDTLRNEVEPALVTDGNVTSSLGESFEPTPMMVPVRGHLDSIKRLLDTSDEVPDSGFLARAATAIHSKYHSMAVRLRYQFSMKFCWEDRVLYASLWTLSGTRLVCHCRSSEPCHGDVLIEEFKKSFPDAFDRYRDDGVPPDSRIRSFMARLREEPESDEGSRVQMVLGFLSWLLLDGGLQDLVCTRHLTAGLRWLTVS